MKIKNILCILCLWISIVGYGQSGKVFTTDGELSNSLINKLYQDRNGFIWIATENGLNRYDGAKVTIYKHDPNDPHSLSHNYVRTLFEDAKGRLFVGTCNGLQIYDAAVIASLSPPDAKMEKSLIVIYPLFCNEKMEISGCPAMNSVNSLLKMMN